MNKFFARSFVLLLITVLFCSACGGSTNTTTSASSDPSSVTLAYQPALGSALLIVLRHQQTLEKQFPHTQIQWKVLNSGSAVREAVIANQAQIGYLGVPPFLVGWAGGFDWKILSAVTSSDVWLVAKDARIKTLKDFKPDDKIGVVAPDSLQAINLRKEAQKELGNAHALDKNLVSIAPADAEQALLSGQITANFASAPYQFKEVAEGGHVVLHSYDIFGHVSSDEIAVPTSFYNQYPNFSKKLYQDLVDAAKFVKDSPDQTADYLANDQIGKATAAQYKTWLQQQQFDLKAKGFLDYANFMKQIGLIPRAPDSEKDLELPTATN